MKKLFTAVADRKDSVAVFADTAKEAKEMIRKEYGARQVSAPHRITCIFQEVRTRWDSVGNPYSTYEYMVHIDGEGRRGFTMLKAKYGPSGHWELEVRGILVKLGYWPRGAFPSEQFEGGYIKISREVGSEKELHRA